jgi:hypothetical protein
MDKAEIAGVLAWLVSVPDAELAGALNSGDIGLVLSDHDIDAGFLSDREFTLDDLNAFYNDCRGKNIYFVESVYKAWSDDSGCDSDLFSKKGFLMGDAAMHMIELYRHCGFEVPESFSGRPDDLTLELDFLAALYENGLSGLALQFITDHLDWLPDLRARLVDSGAPDFYICAVGAIETFIKNERLRLKSLQEVHA